MYYVYVTFCCVAQPQQLLNCIVFDAGGVKTPHFLYNASWLWINVQLYHHSLHRVVSMLRATSVTCARSSS